MNFNVDGFLSSFPEIARALPLTLQITVTSMLIGLLLGTILALLIRFKTPLLAPLAHVYISFFRGTPLLVQLFVLYYGLPQLFPIFSHLDSLYAALIGLSLNMAAYLSESIRGALNAVERAQMDACLAAGMSRIQGLIHVVLPQAARVAVPSLANSFVGLLKESSLIFALGITEILAQAKQYASLTYCYMEAFLAVALVYWAITVLFGAAQRRLEAWLNIPYQQGASA
jgi:putative S-methylcysteine transport system permease protein